MTANAASSRFIIVALLIFSELNLFTESVMKSASSEIYFSFAGEQDSMKVCEIAPDGVLLPGGERS